MKIISEPEFVETVSYRREFEDAGETSCGYSFECDQRGNVDVHNLNPAARENFMRACDEVKAGTLLDLGVERIESSWREPAVGECEVCGGEVYLDGFTCPCDGCGTDYNSSGQRLAPREQWGEETGESLGDIMGPSLIGGDSDLWGEA